MHIVFSAGLNNLQVDQVNTEINTLVFACSQLVASKLITASKTPVQYSGCGLTIRATSRICEQKPQKPLNESMKRLW